MNAITTSLVCLIMLSSCTTGPRDYFKRSANNQIIDARGFQGGKRSPLYNKKYIAKAKRNIITGDYSYTKAPDESIDSAKQNIDFYKSMIHEENKRRQYSKHTPVAKHANLQKELEDIKKILSETKKEMASYKCPSAKQIERELYEESEVILPKGHRK